MSTHVMSYNWNACECFPDVLLCFLSNLDLGFCPQILTLRLKLHTQLMQQAAYHAIVTGNLSNIIDHNSFCYFFFINFVSETNFRQISTKSLFMFLGMLKLAFIEFIQCSCIKCMSKLILKSNLLTDVHPRNLLDRYVRDKLL